MCIYQRTCTAEEVFRRRDHMTSHHPCSTNRAYRVHAEGRRGTVCSTFRRSDQCACRFLPRRCRHMSYDLPYRQRLATPSYLLPGQLRDRVYRLPFSTSCTPNRSRLQNPADLGIHHRDLSVHIRRQRFPAYMLQTTSTHIRLPGRSCIEVLLYDTHRDTAQDQARFLRRSQLCSHSSAHRIHGTLPYSSYNRAHLQAILAHRRMYWERMS